MHVTTFLPSFTRHRRGRNCYKRYKLLAGVWRMSILMRKLSANKSYTWHVCRLAWVHFNRVMNLTMFWGKHEYKFNRHWIMLSYLWFTEEIWCSQWTYGVGARIELIDSYSVFFPKIFRPGSQIRTWSDFTSLVQDGKELIHVRHFQGNYLWMRPKVMLWFVISCLTQTPDHLAYWGRTKMAALLQLIFFRFFASVLAC